MHVTSRLVVPRGARLAVVLALFIFPAVCCTDDPSAQFFSSGHPNQQSSTFDATSGSQSDPTLVDPRYIHGAVDRPDPRLTPGVVATTDLTAVCHESKRVRGMFMPRNPLIAPSMAAAVFAAYNIPAARQTHYGLDFLVPLQLGGANTRANIWPVSTMHGVGFREKEILNIRLHVMVCQRAMPLDQAQRAVASDWVKLWLKVG
jgi:hypothetical protein